MPNKFLQTSAFLGALCVILGAFGAHALKPHLDAYQLSIYEKGIQYQFYHTLALLFVGLLENRMGRSKWLTYSGWAFLAGILFFSGSLYLLACRNLVPFPVGWAGPVTPLGGIGFIAGWIMLWKAVSGRPNL